MSRKFVPLLSMVMAAALAGCASMAPEVPRPAAPALSYPMAPATSAANAPTADLPWQEFFEDARLRRLIEMSLANNRDLRVAVLNIEQARASYRVQESQSVPNVGLNASGTSGRTPGSVSGIGTPLTTHQYGANLGVNAFELDLFGRVRSLNEQALQQFLATEQGRRATHISLVANVASSYLAWAADLDRLALARETLQSEESSTELIRQRELRGFASGLALRQAQSSVEAARADVARFTGQVAKDRNALNLLLGAEIPDDLVPRPLRQQPVRLPEVVAGVPSELMLRRPDLLQAENQLQAANANIGAARAAFYPRISLTGAAGVSSGDLSGLFRGGAGAWSFLPQVTLPIFDGGGNRARLDAATASRDIALAQYEKSILTAFREAADALAERAVIGDQLAAQSRQAELTTQALDLAQARYSRGVDSFLPVLDAQRSAYAAQQALITTQQAEVNSRVELYKVLGGGWSN